MGRAGGWSESAGLGHSKGTPEQLTWRNCASRLSTSAAASLLLDTKRSTSACSQCPHFEFGSTSRVLAKRLVKYYRILQCVQADHCRALKMQNQCLFGNQALNDCTAQHATLCQTQGDMPMLCWGIPHKEHVHAMPFLADMCHHESMLILQMLVTTPS